MLSVEMAKVLLGGKQVREVHCVDIVYTVNGQQSRNANVCDDETVVAIALKSDGELEVVRDGKTRYVNRDFVINNSVFTKLVRDRRAVV